MARLVEKEADVVRYFVRENFNPASSKQLLAYMRAKGIRPGRNYKTGADSVDHDTLEKLTRKDPFFQKILDYREIQKIKGTYVAPNLTRADEESRLHSSFLHVPSNMRLSSHDPNLQNVPDDEDADSYARRFRNCIVAAPDCLLVEADYASIEAVLTGYFAHDLNLMRIGSMGVHSLVLANLLSEPVDLGWPDDDLAKVLAAIKAKHKHSDEYRACKVAVHATDYGGSAMAVYMANPGVFGSLRNAERICRLYLDLFPTLPPWWKMLRERASSEHCLGGADHPFHYKHWFWDVVTFHATRGKIPGSDWNKVVSFYPASTAAGVLYEAVLRLVDPASPCFVGDLYHGKTPLRSLIHDSVLAEIPTPFLDRYVHHLVTSMTSLYPQLPYTDASGDQALLSFGVDVKVGHDWGSMVPLSRWRSDKKILHFQEIRP